MLVTPAQGAWSSQLEDNRWARAGDTCVPPGPVSQGHPLPGLAAWMERLSGLLLAERPSEGSTPPENKTWMRCWLQFSSSTKGTGTPAPLGLRRFGNQVDSDPFQYSPMICFITLLHDLCVSSSNSQLLKSPPAHGDGKEQSKISQGYRGTGVGFNIIFNRTTPAAVLSHLCYCIQHFLALCSRQTSFTQVNGSLISLNLPEVVPGLFWGKRRTWYWKQIHLLHGGNFHTACIHQFSSLTNIWQDVPVKLF